MSSFSRAPDLLESLSTCNPTWYYVTATLLAILLIDRWCQITERVLSLAVFTSGSGVMRRSRPSRVQFSLWKGYFTLRDVALQADFVNSLDLPFLCQAATIARIQIMLPWAKSAPRALTVVVSDVTITATTRRHPQFCCPDVFERQQAQAIMRQRVAKLSAVDNILWNRKPPWPFFEQARAFVFRHLAYLVTRLLEVDLRNISIAVTLDRCLPLGSDNRGAPIRAPTAAEGLGSTLTLKLQGLTVHNSGADSYGVLSTDVSLRGISVDIEQPPASPDEAGSDREPGHRTSVVRRWNVSMVIGWRLASGFFDRVAQRLGSAKAPVFRVEVFAHALLLHHNAASLRSFLGFQATCLHFLRFSSYYRLRPQVSVGAAPQHWWQHAGRIILLERLAVLGSHEAASRGVLARRALRREHERTYLRQRVLLWRVALALCGRLRAYRRALQKLEGRLTDEEAAQFRWWAWAKRRRAFAGRGADISEELAKGMAAVDTVLLARGMVRQKRSRPLRAQLTLHCPKFAVVFENTGAAAASSIGLRPVGPRLVVAAKELRCTVLAGSQESEQLQSGAGPLSVQASCSEFHVSHGVPIPPEAGGAAASASGGADALKEQALWLIKSPSRSSSSNSPSREKQKLPQAFLTLSYRQPPLRAVKPSQTRLVIAPIDAVYSQAVLLHVTAFLNAAWPPPALDPLTVRTTVTLREIVTERLVGRKRPHQLQKHQQALQQLQVKMGDVRLLLPCGEASSQDAQRRLTRTTTLNVIDPADAAEEPGQAEGFEDSQPTMAVLVLGGFSAVTAPHQQRGPSSQPSRLPVSSMRSIGENDLDDYAFIPANPPPHHSPRASLERMRSLEDSAEVSPVRTLSRLSLLQDWDKANGFADPLTRTSGMPQLHRTSTFPKPASGKLEKGSWLRQRPGATQFEILQVRFSVQAFLARPVDVGMQTFDDCAQVVEPFSITTSIDRAVEPAPMGLYRRVVQIDVTTTEVHVEMSQYVKRELHSLFNYLHSSFVDEELTSTISRHFTKREASGQIKPSSSHTNLQATPGPTQNIEFNFGGAGRRGGSTEQLRPAPSTALTDTVTANAEGSEVADSQDPGQQEHRSYGLVLALQVGLPMVAVHAVQSLNAEFPDHPQPLFQFCLSEVQYTLAAEDSLHDVRFAIGAVSVEDLAREAHSPVILGPTPRCVDERRHGQRPIMQRFFQAWRNKVAQQSVRPRNARHSAQHLLLTTGAQLSGHITSTAEGVSANLDSSFLCASVEIGAIGRLLQYMNELALAEPREPASLEPLKPVTQGSGRGKSGTLRAAPLGARTTTLSPQEKAPGPSDHQAAVQLQTGPSKPSRAPQTALSLQAYCYLLHVDVIMERQRFSTIMCEGLGAAYDSTSLSPQREMLLECSGLQVMDRLCASPHLSQAVSVSSDKPWNESLLRMSFVVHQTHHAQAGAPSSFGLQHASLGSTRAGGVDSGDFGRADLLRTGRSRAQERRQRRQMRLQNVVRVECENLVLTVVCRFLYDWMHFSKEVQGILESVAWGSTPAPTSDSTRPPQYYRPITEVVLTNFRMDVPRNSFSREMFTLNSEYVRMLLPVSEAQLSKLKPNMDGPRSRPGSLSANASFAQREWRGQNLWRRPSEDRDMPSTLLSLTDAPDRFSQGAFAVDGEDDFLSLFHHWDDATPVSVALQLGSAHLTWRCKRAGAAGDMSRQVWDGSRMLLSFQQDMARTTVWIPWANCIAGEVQYQLVLACLWENAYEPSSFGPTPPMWHPIGTPLPKHPPQPEVLGVDRSSPPVWEVEVNIMCISGLMEKVPLPTSAPGCGPKLAKVRMRDVQILVGTYSDGSMSIVVCSGGLRIHDTRNSRTQQPARTHHHDSTLVLAIGADWHDVSPGLPGEEAEAPAQRAQGLWSQVRHAVRDGGLADPQLLSSRSSFQWDTLHESSGHRRLRSFRESAEAQDWRRTTSTRPDGPVPPSPFEQDLNRPNADSAEPAEQSTNGTVSRPEPVDGFFVEYVMQANPRKSDAELVVWGPHVAECVMRGARLQWPYAGNCEFLWDVMELFQHYIMVPWVAPFPETENGVQWMYINLLIENSTLFVPIQDDTSEMDLAFHDVQPGMGFNWSQLRLGYFYGGHGECVLRFNAHELSALGRLRTGHQQDLSAPFKSAAEVLWHQPQMPGKHWDTSIMVKVTHLKLQPAFAHVPLVHSAMHLMQSSLQHQKQEVVSTGELSEVGHGITPIPERFRSSSLRVNLNVDSVTVALVDDRHGNHIEVLAIAGQDVDCEFAQECLLQGTPASTFGKVTLSLAVRFLNSALDATEPMVEAWPFNLEYSHKGTQRNVSLHSSSRLNVIINPASFRSLGDARSFVLLLSQVAVPELSGSVKRTMGRWLSTSRVTSLYRLVNRSGLRLSYWVDAPGDQGQSEAYSLNPWEESPLQVEPVEKTVILPDSQLQVMARTISMQFEGNWTPVSDIVVDKVGKYAYIIGSPHDTAITPVVMDVTLDVRTKVLTVHSPFRIENCTNKPLEFVVHMFLGPNLQDALPAMRGSASTTRVPSSGPLLPGLQCYLPAPAIWGGVMYMRAVDWKMSMKDKINLEGPKLKEKQGLYTCPPERPGEQPFHCCLEVKEELIKMSMKDGNILNALPEYVLRFHPPLVIHNVLPFEIIITLADSTTQGDAPKIPIAVGDSVEVYHFSMNRKIRMAVQMQDYKCMRPVNIHYPPSQYLDDSARGSLFADLPGLRLGKSIQLVKEAVSTTTASPLVFGPQGNRLTLRLHNKMNSHSRAREVFIFCPYWVVNKTNLALLVRDTTPQRGSPTLASPGLGDVAQPLPFSSGRGSMRLSVHASFWSRAINLEALGIHQSIHVMGPGTATTTAREHASAAAEGEEVVRYDSETIIAPRSVSPSRRRNTSRLGSRFSNIHKADSWESIAGGVLHNPMMQPPETPRTPLPRPSRDVGHLPHLSLLTCAAVPLVSGEGDPLGTIRRHEFAVETSPGPSIFHRTKVITITSRYMLFNNSQEALQYGQRGTSLVWQLPPGARYPFHWDSADCPFQLCIRPGIGNWNWSGAFQIDNAGDFGLRVHNPSRKQHRILPVDISLNSAAFLITVGKATLAPPYRVENRCEGLIIKFQQKELDHEEWEQVDAGGAVDYAWEEPMFTHRLRIFIDSDAVAYKDNVLHEYNLDVIKAHPVIKLRRTNYKMVQKMASTMGRAFTSGMSIASKGAMLATASSSQTGMQGPAQAADQPELDARYVYVGVHADGPTRVLCFSDTRDQYTRGTNEESVALLSTRLKRLEERIQKVNEQLQTYNERQGIDMALAMSLGNRRSAGRAGRDHSPISSPEGMHAGHARTLSWEVLSSGDRLGSIHSMDGQDAALTDLALAHHEYMGRQSPPEAAHARVSHFFRSSLSLVRDVKRKHVFRTSSEVSEAGDSPLARPGIQQPHGRRLHGYSSSELVAGLPHAPPDQQDDAAVPDFAASASASRQASRSVDKDVVHLSHLSMLPEHAAREGAPAHLGHVSALPERITREAPVLRHMSTPIAEIFGRPSMAVRASMPAIADDSAAGSSTSAQEPAKPALAESSSEPAGLPHSMSAISFQDTEIHASRELSPRGSGSMVASRIGLPKLRKRSALAQHQRAATIGSPAELDALRPLHLDSGHAGDMKKPLSDEILGGELVVTINACQGLMAAWRSKEEHVRKALHSMPGSQAFRAQGPKKGHVYCILTCEGQVKRTSLAVGHVQPAWNEEVTFRAVQITSDLQVTVYGRGRLGHDIFLGEVVIALRELEEVSSDQPPDIRQYVLGRRSAKEKVSGEISLACSWRVTPLDVASIKVKARQTELDRKEEVLALLLERYSTSPQRGLAPIPTAGERPLDGGSRKSMTDVKRMQGQRGQLAVKVIEARNMRLPSDMLHAFFTMDAYAVASVSTEAGVTSHQTRVVRNNLMPIWNEKLAFEDVALGNMLSLALYDHKKLTSDVFLGQATLPVMRFSDSKPHYLWLPMHGNPLARRSGMDPGASNQEPPSTGELHVRVQWTNEESEQATDDLPSLVAELGLCGIGVSVVDASFLRLPREVLHALLEDIHLDFRYSSAAQSSKFAIRSIQIDDQLLTSAHPVVLAPTQSSNASIPTSMEAEPMLQSHHALPPFVEVAWEMLHHNPSILYFKALSLVIQEVDLVLEEDFLDLLAMMLREMPSEELWQMPSTTRSGASDALEAGMAGASMLTEVLDATATTSMRGAQRGVGRKWYFEKLDLHGIRCNLTLVPHGGFREWDTGGAVAAATRYRVASTLGINIIEINSVPLRVNALQLKNAFVTPRALLSQLMRHLFFQALHETHKILGQVDILGSPIVLGTSLVTGLRQFITEPLKAHNPKQFVIGLGHGTLALAKYGAFGLLLAFEQLLGGTAKGLAMLTMDQEYINRFRVRPSSYRQRMLQGVQAAGVGIYEGIIGLVREPVTGWQDDGVVGALVGLAMGTSGLLLKPSSGVLAFIAKMLGGLGAGIRAWGDDIVRAPRTRIRSPRQFGALTGDTAGDALNFTRWRAAVARLHEGRYASETVLDFLQNKDRKAIIITSNHIIYINTHRQRIRWAFSLTNLTSVSASGLVVLLHHQLSMRVGGKWPLHLPVRKRVECRTRDLHQSLIVKLSRAISRAAGEQQDPATARRLQRTASLNQDNLHIMNQARLHPMGKSSLQITEVGEALPSDTPSPEAGRPSAEASADAARSGQPAQLAGVKQAEGTAIPAKAPGREGVHRQGKDQQQQQQAAKPIPQLDRSSVRFARSQASPVQQGAGGGQGQGARQVADALQVARDLCGEASAPTTPAEEAAQHLRTVALLCQECVEGARQLDNDVASMVLSLAAVARANASASRLQQAEARSSVLSPIQLVITTATHALASAIAAS